MKTNCQATRSITNLILKHLNDDIVHLHTCIIIKSKHMINIFLCIKSYKHISHSKLTSRIFLEQHTGCIVCVCVYVCACVRACVCVCVRACVRACVCVIVTCLKQLEVFNFSLNIDIRYDLLSKVTIPVFVVVLAVSM